MAQRAEHAITGLASGIMDQMAVACGQHVRALLLDCRTLAIEDVVIPEGVAIVIVHSGVERRCRGARTTSAAPRASARLRRFVN